MTRRRVAVYLDADELAEVQARAAAHRMPVSVFVRAAALEGARRWGDGPDQWWDALPSSRKESIQAWLTAHSTPTDHQIPGQVVADFTG